MGDTQNKLDPGVSVIGNQDDQTILVVNTAAVPDKPSILCLNATTDTTGVKTPFYLWVDSDGKLRTGSAIPTDQDGSGTIVGTMS